MGAKRSERPRSKKCTLSGSPPGWAVTAIPFRSPPPASRVSKTCVMGAPSPGLPKVHLHNPVLAYEVGDEFMKYWDMAAEGRKLDPFVLVVEGLRSPTRRSEQEGYWAVPSAPIRTDRPTDHDLRMDRPPGAWHWPWLGPAPARPMAASMRWQAIRPAAWAWPIIWAGAGKPRPAFRSSTCRAASRPARHLHGNAPLPALPGGRFWHR